MPYASATVDTQTLRSRYRPRHVRVLLVGESPPVGGTFFYAANSNLYRYTRQAFVCAFEREWPTDESFLDFLRKFGFFLEDLCLEPINGMTKSDRRSARAEGEQSLTDRLVSMQPHYVAVTPKAIANHVTRSLASAGIDVQPALLPFPAMSWQADYVAAMAGFLRCIASID